MPPPAVRCTIRSMMIAVAGVGMVIGGATRRSCPLT